MQCLCVYVSIYISNHLKTKIVYFNLYNFENYKYWLRVDQVTNKQKKCIYFLKKLLAHDNNSLYIDLICSSN